MSDSQYHSTLTFASILSITLLSWLVLLPIINQIELPFFYNNSGIVSTVTVEEISPYTDYLKFAILLLSPAAISFFLSLVNPLVRTKILELILTIINHKTVISIFTIFLIFIWSVDRIFPDVGVPLIDSFHEGEYLGYLPNFTQLEKPFLKSIFIHGFGLDTVPSLFAHWWVGNGNNEIAMTRFFYSYLSLFATFVYFWVLWEIALLSKSKNAHHLFLMIVIVFCLTEKFFFLIDGGRSLIFMIQLALVLRFFRIFKLEKLKPIHLKRIAFFVGGLIPISFLHTYDRAIYFVLIYFWVSILSLIISRNTSCFWLLMSILGIIFSGILILSILGYSQVFEILFQVSYWSKYSRDMFALPMPDLEINLVNHLYWLSMLVQSTIVVYLLVDFQRKDSIGKFIRENLYILILLPVCLVYMRIGLDRSKLLMAAQGAFPTFALVAYVSARSYKKYWEHRLSIFLKKPDRQILLVILAFALIRAEPGFSISNLSGRFDNLGRSNLEILQPAQLEVVEAFKPEIDRQSCFYTATTEGIWYYLFNKPSCSKFGNLYYALPTVAQKVVARELEATQPNLILLTDTVILTGRTIADSTPIIFQYILDRYRPDRLVAERWLWRRNETPLQFARNATSSGTLERWCIAAEERECQTMPEPGERQKLRRGKPIYTLEGSAILPEQNRPADAVYLSYGSSNRLVTVSRVNGDGTWNLAIPSMTLPLGKEIVRVWAYNGSRDRLQPIGYDIEIEILR